MRNIENCLIGLSEVEMVVMFVVVLVGKDGRWGGNEWGKEKYLRKNFADVEKMGKPRKRKIAKPFVFISLAIAFEFNSYPLPLYSRTNF